MAQSRALAGPSALQAGDPVDLGRALLPGEIVQGLRRCDLTGREIAVAVGVSDRAVRGWLQGGRAVERHAQTLYHLRATAMILRDGLTLSGVGHWFRSPNRLLGNRRPLDVIASDPKRVADAAAAFAEGAFV